MWYDTLTNTRKNLEMLAKPGTEVTRVLTIYDGKILDYDARNGPITPAIIDRYWLFDMDKALQAKALGAAGKKEESDALKDESRSPAYKDLLVEYQKQKKQVEKAGYVPPHSVLKPLAAAGQTVDTAYELVRRINYLPKLSGKSYLMERFQARNVVAVENVNDLNFKGFTDEELLEGQPEIADDTTPFPAKKKFGTFEKQIFADSFRYDLGMREKKDSQFNIEERITRQVPGIMEKMINEKIVAIINAKASSSDLADWDAKTSGLGFDNDAAEHIEDAENAIEDYGGTLVLIAPRQVIRLYKRNTQGVNVETAESGQTTRSGQLPFNEHIRYFIDNAITANTFTLISKENYIDWYNGPKLNVTAKNPLTPGAEEMNIFFHFNGVNLKIDASARKHNGVT